MFLSTPSYDKLLGMKWEGLYFFDMVLHLWSQVSPLIFDEFSCMIEWTIQTKLKILKVIHILDDFFFATPSPSLIGQKAWLPCAKFYIRLQS